MDYFASNSWALWILIALVAGLLELMLPYFTFVFISLSAVVSAIISNHVGWEGQAVVFSATLLLSMFLIRPLLVKRFHTSHKMPSRSQALRGLKGEVTEAVDSMKNTGRVMVAGEDWSAKSDVVLQAGCAIEVVSADGIVLIVKEI